MIRNVIRLATIAAAALALPAQASASIAFRSESHASVQAAHSLTLTTPAGVAPGDVMIATVAVGGPHIAIAAPGWTSIRTTTAGPALQQLSFYRVATASEPAGWTFAAASGSDDLSGGVVAYSGIDVANPVDAVADTSGPGATSIPSVVTTSAGDAVVGALALGSTATVSLDASVTPRYTAALGKAQALVGDFVQDAAGATGARSAATSGPAGERSGQAIALRAASAQPDEAPGGGDAPTANPESASTGWTLASGQPVTPDILAALPILSTDTNPTVVASRAVPVKIDCPAVAVAGCRGLIELLGSAGDNRVGAARRRKVAGKRFKVAAGKHAAVAVPLDRRTIRRFARSRRAKVTLRVTVQTSAGAAVKATTVTIKARRTTRHFPPPKRRHR